MSQFNYGLTLGGGYQGYPDTNTLAKPMQLNFGLPASEMPTPFKVGIGEDNPYAVAFQDPAAGATAPGAMSGFTKLLQENGVLGSTDTKTGIKTDGWGSMALSAGTGLFNAYMGMKQYGLFKDQLNFQKNSFERNFSAQRDSVNTQLEDRQKARVAANPGAYQSVGDYMAANRMKG